MCPSQFHLVLILVKYLNSLLPTLCLRSDCMAWKASSFSKAEFFVTCTALIWLKACEQECNFPYEKSAHLSFWKEKLLPSLMYERAGTQSHQPWLKTEGLCWAISCPTSLRVGWFTPCRDCETFCIFSLVRRYPSYKQSWKLHERNELSSPASTLQLPSSSCVSCCVTFWPQRTMSPPISLWFFSPRMPQPFAGMKPGDLVTSFCLAPTVTTPLANTAWKEEGRCHPNAWVEVSCTEILWWSC